VRKERGREERDGGRREYLLFFIFVELDGVSTDSDDDDEGRERGSRQ
jgi:hypothetical protein